jgi:hypothetical protein
MVSKKRTVWVIVTRDDEGRIKDLEVLDMPPMWDLAALGQIAFMANVNGGDSVRWASGDKEWLL